MSPLKFRAWNSINQIMSSDGIFFNNSEGTLKHDPAVIVMQSTGLKDKNGVEIFESDVVKFDGNIWIVCWYLMHGGFTLKSVKPVSTSDYIASAGVPIRGFNWLDEGKAGYLQIQKRSSPVEVIGNVWKNPDLLLPSADDR